jgi:hypothetical protein
MMEKPANLWIGGLTALAGLIGIGIGMWLPDLLQRRTRRAYQLWAAMVVFLAVPFSLAGILDPNVATSLGLIFVGKILLASTLGPGNTVPANVVPPNLRAAAYALNIFLIHLLGDISSPPLVGWISDALGRPQVAASWLGRLLAAIGAVPVEAQSTGSGHLLSGPHPTNLTAGMLLMVPVLVLGGFFFLRGSRHLPQDQDRVRKDGSTRSRGALAH